MLIQKISSCFITSLTLITLFLLPIFANAAPTSVVAPTKLKNPLKFNSLEELLVSILNIVVILATPIVVFFIIYAGYLYVTARGNAAQTEQATRALTYAIIGGVLIIGAVAIAQIVKNLVTAFVAG